jgi:hypothetical protein
MYGTEGVAALAAVTCRLLREEELRVEALAHEAALHVGEARDDSVDGAGGDVLLQLLDRQHLCRHYTDREGCNVCHISLASREPGRSKEGET